MTIIHNPSALFQYPSDRSKLQTDDGNTHRRGIGLVPHVMRETELWTLYLTLVGSALELEV